MYEWLTLDLKVSRESTEAAETSSLQVTKVEALGGDPKYRPRTVSKAEPSVVTVTGPPLPVNVNHLVAPMAAELAPHRVGGAPPVKGSPVWVVKPVVSPS